MTTNEKISQLRTAMLAAGAEVCLIPSSDPHVSEYLPAHWAARSYFSGFTGSMGTLVVTSTGSALWADGRYFIQAERQIAGSEIELQRIGVEGVPTVNQYIADHLSEGQFLALDGMVTPTDTVKQLEKLLSKKGAGIKSVDLVSGCWEDRPAIPSTPAYLLDVKYAGLSAKEKLALLRKELDKKETKAMVIPRLDSVAWLLNLRASDLECTPFALAFCFVTPDDAMLFIDRSRLPKEAEEALGQQGVQVVDYDKLLGTLTAYHHNLPVLVDTAGTNWAIYNTLRENPAFTLVEGGDPIQALKGIKNETEIKNNHNAHVKDGVAMVRFQMWMEDRMTQGIATTELDVAEVLKKLRSEQDLNTDTSFGTIAAYGANAAMMHYQASAESFATLEPHGLLLVDSGGQYLDGTTDITRTYALGELTDNERTYYTYTLKSHIDMAKLQFLSGCTGGNLDIIARAPVWAHGIDYRCGTGHGVGFYGNVHEGPHSLRVTNNVVFKPGMVVTDEPGVYEEGELGIRIENELLCVEKEKNQYGQFLGFETITFCPIDLTPVRPELLDQAEKDWLNAFHKNVYETLKPHLTQHEADWLLGKTLPLA